MTTEFKKFVVFLSVFFCAVFLHAQNTSRTKQDIINDSLKQILLTSKEDSITITALEDYVSITPGKILIQH